MRISVNLSVKGTKFYEASDLLQQGTLSSGLAIFLEHQPDNPYDKNAIAVRIKNNGAMLGHLSRGAAPKYAALILESKILDASVAKVEKNGDYISIYVRVVYEQSDEPLEKKHNSRLWLSASVMPTKAGVYAIRNINSGRQYIGSSINLKDRFRSHIKDLSRGCHANPLLQSDFSHLGADYFEAKVIVENIFPSNLASEEADQIKLMLNSGAALYNMTVDGQGTGNSGPHIGSKPVSDRLLMKQDVGSERPTKKKVSEEQRRMDAIFFAERKAVIDEYASKLSALLPNTNFWIYFLTTFVGSLLILTVVIPKINNGSLIIISAIFAFVISPFIIFHFHEKAKHSAQYKNLIRQRDEQLSAIDNERGKKQE